MDEKKNIQYKGELDLNGIKIPCYVLDDGTRVLSGRGMQEALKMVDDNKKHLGPQNSKIPHPKDTYTVHYQILRGGPR